jgi:hypothetical protein
LSEPEEIDKLSESLILLSLLALTDNLFNSGLLIVKLSLELFKGNTVELFLVKICNE